MTDAPERNTDKHRNLILNRALTDLERIINSHDPEIDVPIDQGVWDRLDEIAVEIENHSTPTRAQWRPIDTAPEGLPRIKGASKVCWMIVAWPDGEGGTHSGHGMRVNDKFYSSSIFHCGGPFDGKQKEFREVEVFPTHWMPLPHPPAQEGLSDG